jgi:hypothetical protein
MSWHKHLQLHLNRFFWTKHKHKTSTWDSIKKLNKYPKPLIIQYIQITYRWVARKAWYSFKRFFDFSRVEVELGMGEDNWVN